MKYTPILFSTPMVQAIMNGSKTQTRRIVKSKETLTEYEGVLENGNVKFWSDDMLGKHLWHTEDGEFLTRPKCEVNDIFWVRETFVKINIDFEFEPSKTEYAYKASFEEAEKTYGKIKNGTGKRFIDSWKWKPSIFMPKDACRTFLKTLKVRVERVQDISEQDSIAEGVIPIVAHNDPTRILGYHDYTVKPKDGFNTLFTAKESFESLWVSINGQESWDSNPYVFVYDFTKIEKPKDFK